MISSAVMPDGRDRNSGQKAMTAFPRRLALPRPIPWCHGVIDTMEVEWHAADERWTAMPRPMESSAKRPRISVDVVPEVRRRLRLAAARRDVSVRQYVVEAIEERLREDLGDESEGLLVLNAKADPLLAELWDNRRDAAYDRLRSR